MRSLREIGLACGTDKVSKHGYDVWYERHLDSLRLRPLKLLEIGVATGASLRMWEEYFPDAAIFAIDFDPRCRELGSPRTTIFIGNQAEPEFLRHVIRSIHGGLDVIIDDGGHRMPEQQTALRTLFSALRPGGFFVMEDVETSYYSDYGGGVPGQRGTTLDVLKGLIDNLNAHYHGHALDSFDVSFDDKVWTELAPQDYAAASGVPLRVLPDQSLLVSRPVMPTDSYIVKAAIPLPAVTALRLEALPDSSLPHGGPGNSDNGNFVLTALQIRWHSSAGARPIELTNASASFAQTGFGVHRVLTAEKTSGWGIYPRINRASELVVQLAEPLVGDAQGRLTAILEQAYGARHTLGRFRLSVSDRVPAPTATAGPTVQGIHFYPNICFVQRGSADTVTWEAPGV